MLTWERHKVYSQGPAREAIGKMVQSLQHRRFTLFRPRVAAEGEGPLMLFDPADDSYCGNVYAANPEVASILRTL